ncbi:MAG: outer membrane protein [Hyphomicrobiales bacterium]|nr:outer membrane protein [Hyphomicrobiales bacterium]
MGWDLYCHPKTGSVDSGADGEKKKAENEIALQVNQVYYALLIARLQREAAERQISYSTEHLKESEEDVRNGNALHVDTIAARADFLESNQALLTVDIQLSNLNAELDDLLGIPLDTQLDLDPAVPQMYDQQTREEYLRVAVGENPEIRAAE